MAVIDRASPGNVSLLPGRATRVTPTIAIVRSISSCLSQLFALEGISFISIQPDLRGGDDELLARHNITQVGDKLADMADTAAIVTLADITIAVDTSVAHLAGALGREAWVPLPFSPDWRWTLSGEHSPWSASPASASVRAGRLAGRRRRGARCAVAHQHNAMMLRIRPRRG